MSIAVLKRRRLNKMQRYEHILYRSDEIHKFINKFMKHGKKAMIERHLTKSLSNIKSVTKRSPLLTIFESLSILRPYTILVKFYTRQESRRKRAKRARHIPVPVRTKRQRVIASTWLNKIILYQKKLRHRDNHEKLYRLDQKTMSSVSKKRGFADRFHISLRGQELHNLITNKLIDLFKTNYIQLRRYKVRYFTKITNRRAFMHFRWA